MGAGILVAAAIMMGFGTLLLAVLLKTSNKNKE